MHFSGARPTLPGKAWLRCCEAFCNDHRMREERIQTSGCGFLVGEMSESTEKSHAVTWMWRSRWYILELWWITAVSLPPYMWCGLNVTLGDVHPERMVVNRSLAICYNSNLKSWKRLSRTLNRICCTWTWPTQHVISRTLSLGFFLKFSQHLILNPPFRADDVGEILRS